MIISFIMMVVVTSSGNHDKRIEILSAIGYFERSDLRPMFGKKLFKVLNVLKLYNAITYDTGSGIFWITDKKFFVDELKNRVRQ